MKLFIFIAVLFITSLPTLAQDHDLYLNAVLRYESDQEHNFIKDRERLRIIANAGVKSQWDDNWSTVVQFRTGVKNRQNSAALTFHRITDQSLGERDVFLERAYVAGKFENISFKAGKIPWSSKQLTDIFWDRDLSPIGVAADWKIAKNHTLHVSQMKPLDGDSSTVGDMTLIQWQAKYQWEDMQFVFMPWYVNYSGDEGIHARRDTHLDNEFIRLSAYIKTGEWRIGADIGHSLESDSNFADDEFQDENSSYAFEVRHGRLKEEGDILAQFRTYHVERYGVITEFAQNAASRFATSNMQGWEVRWRRQMAPNWWFGMRYMDTKTIVGPEEVGKRLRFEAKFSF